MSYFIAMPIFGIEAIQIYQLKKLENEALCTDPVKFFWLPFAQFVQQRRQVVPRRDRLLQKRHLIFGNCFNLASVNVIKLFSLSLTLRQNKLGVCPWSF